MGIKERANDVFYTMSELMSEPQTYTMTKSRAFCCVRVLAPAAMVEYSWYKILELNSPDKGNGI